MTQTPLRTTPDGPSERAPRTHRAYMVWVLVVALGVVAVADGAVRAMQDRLDEPLQWYNGVAQTREEEMNRLADLGIRSDLAFIGTSMVNRAVVVEAFEERLPTVAQAHNLALPAAQTTVVERWTLEEVLPTLKPTRVVWGVASLDFNPNRANPPIETYDVARATRTGILGELDRLLDRLALSHYRQTLRDLSFIDDLDTVDEPRSVAAPADALPGGPSDRGRKNAAERRRLRTRVVNDYATGERELAAFANTVEALLASGTEVVVVFMPITRTYVAAHPNGQADVDEFYAEVRAVTDTLGITVIDLSTAMRGPQFADYTHLNAEGAASFSAELAERLAELGW